MNIEHDLTEGLKDPEKAREVVKKVQHSINELVEANKESIKAAEDANAISREAQRQLKEQFNISNDLAQTVKNITSVLLRKKELFKDDKEMNELLDTLSTYITSSGAIKMGVMRNAENKNKV